MGMFSILLIICLIGIFYLGGAVLSLYFLITGSDKELRSGYFDNAVGSSFWGFVAFGIGLAGFFNYFNFTKSFVTTTVGLIITVPCFFIALYGFVKWLDSNKLKELEDDKRDAYMFIGMGLTGVLLSLLYAYVNE